jgi:RNA polymerase sigma-70 factor (ECF subfamily)
MKAVGQQGLAEVDPKAYVAPRDKAASFHEVADWPDARLMEAVRRDPPNITALDVLADRYWKALFGRCYMLTLNQEKARDLAQQTWCRILQARRNLKPDGNFRAYLMTAATNLWRDAHRWARRAGPMADDRLASLDESVSNAEGEYIALADVLPDLDSLEAEQRALLKLDLDRALSQLGPQARDVLIARYIAGESCAEIGRRCGRTEQTISGWIRQAIQEIKIHLEHVNLSVSNNP